MFAAGVSEGHPGQSSSGVPNSSHSESFNHPRGEDIPVLTDITTEAHSTSITGKRPSAARAFLKRTLARLWRQSRRASHHNLISLPRGSLTKDQGNLPLPDASRLPGRDSFASLTRLVLHGTNEVSFSLSSFFRRVEEVHAIGTNSGSPLAHSPPLPPRRPLPRPRRRPPPPVDEAPTRAMPLTPSLSRNHTSTTAQTTPRESSSTKPEFDSVLELQALAMELDNLNPLPANSPPLASRHLRASPSIKSAYPRPSLWSTSPSPTLNLGRDPLSELLAVADELKTMKNLDSDDILYMTDALPLSPLPPTLHAFLDAPNASLRILEMEIHREDETFLGVPIPCIVVTSEGEPLSTEAPDMHFSLLPPPLCEDLLAPPPTISRGDTDADQPSIMIDGCEHGSPSLPLPSCEPMTGWKEETGDSPSPSYDCPEYSLADANLSWELVGTMDSSALSNQCRKPDRPTAPKPAPLLRRHERSLLRRILGGDDGSNISPVEKGELRCICSKQKRKRISKEAIGSPRPLSPTSQAIDRFTTVHHGPTVNGLLVPSRVGV
ncbi:hypothetical protein BJV74DRAFT_797646 [Russula compacta]|nr:hypothetical protein BJV74DRAFT_797646 [Russula compacta]